MIASTAVRDDAQVGYTLVSLHAHPDDECLLTGGTLARAAAEGHRVVLAVATAGEHGLAARQAVAPGTLADRRVEELHRSAAALGIDRVCLLGYDDSGMDGKHGRDGYAFARVDVETAARRVAALLREERADAMTIYDDAGGYGHPDHVQVHRVGVRAAELAKTALVLEATVDRTSLQRALRLVWLLGWHLPDWRPDRFDRAYTARDRVTHRVDVRRYTTQKRAAMAAHATQATGDVGERTLAAFLRMPLWLFRTVFGREWFVERTRPPQRSALDDVFATLRDRHDRGR